MGEYEKVLGEDDLALAKKAFLGWIRGGLMRQKTFDKRKGLKYS